MISRIAKTSSSLARTCRSCGIARTLAAPALHRSRREMVHSTPNHGGLYTTPLVLVPARFASSVSAPSTSDPVPLQAEQLMVKGLECMAEGDLEGAGQAFQRSIDMSETPAALYNLALVLYQQGEVPRSITAFERSLVLEPSADAHTNVASAYILSTPPNATKAIEHLQKALELAPDDGEISFNMGVIFEASNRLEDAMREYTRAQNLGIERAAQCIRNVGGKLVEKKRTESS